MGNEQNTTEVEVEVAQATEMTPVCEEVLEESECVNAEECTGDVLEEGTPDASEAKAETPVDEDEEDPYAFPKVYSDNIFGKCHKAIDQGWEWVKKKLHIPTLTKKQKAAIWDKITTGILIFLFCTPFLVLLYILLWFVLK